MAESVYVQNDDGTEREVTDSVERDALYAAITAGTVVSRVRSAPPLNSKRLILNAVNAVTHYQDEADRAASVAEQRSRTYQVFKRPTPGHPKTPAEEPEVVTFGVPGDVFDATDLAQFRSDYGANRVVPLP